MLLVVLVLLIPLLTEKPFPPWVTALVAVVPIGFALGPDPRHGRGAVARPAIGMIVVLIGGALIATDAVLMFTAPNRARAWRALRARLHLVEPAVRPQHLGYREPAVGRLVVLEEEHERARDRARGSVERVHELCTRTLAAKARAQPTAE